MVNQIKINSQCPLCKSELKTYYLTFTLTIVMCSNAECPYPLDDDNITNYIAESYTKTPNIRYEDDKSDMEAVSKFLENIRAIRNGNTVTYDLVDATSVKDKSTNTSIDSTDKEPLATPKTTDFTAEEISTDKSPITLDDTNPLDILTAPNISDILNTAPAQKMTEIDMLDILNTPLFPMSTDSPQYDTQADIDFFNILTSENALSSASSQASSPSTTVATPPQNLALPTCFITKKI